MGATKQVVVSDTLVPIVMQGELIPELNLQPIKFKLMSKDEGRGWDRETTKRIETQYRRFLFLNLQYPGKHIVPTKEVDEFWHQHILDTRKYAEDCQMIFGRFLHHFPYFGMRGPKDAENLRQAFVETNELCVQHFGEKMSSTADCSSCDSSACSGQPSCGSSCTGMV